MAFKERVEFSYFVILAVDPSENNLIDLFHLICIILLQIVINEGRGYLVLLNIQRLVVLPLLIGGRELNKGFTEFA